jgi:hypothetical protein
MSNHVEIEEFFSPERVEWAYRMACRAQKEQRQRLADIAMRAAHARDPKLLKALEKGAEIVTRMDEEQRGRTRRSSEFLSEQGETTETQLWREAYRLMDEGRPIRNFEWIYVAGAYLAGFVL